MKLRSCFLFLGIYALLWVLPLLVSCRDIHEYARDGQCKVRIMTWNTQTFFDAVEDGTEFPEYRGTKTVWSEERYRARLERLAGAIALCGEASGMDRDQFPDFCVLQEIESARVIRDLCNLMPQRNGYSDAVFIPPQAGNAFGSAILSRCPVESVRAHMTEGGATALRPLIEAEFLIDGSPLVLFAVHWKSKAGTDDTDGLRRAQEGLLASRIAALESDRPGTPWVACGDFNQKSDEFTLLADACDAWDWWRARRESGTPSCPSGSYYYQGEWEDIDHFFYSNLFTDGIEWEFSGMTVVSVPPLVDTQGLPDRYELFSGKGYSDHLPLVMELTIAQ